MCRHKYVGVHSRRVAPAVQTVTAEVVFVVIVEVSSGRQVKAANTGRAQRRDRVTRDAFNKSHQVAVLIAEFAWFKLQLVLDPQKPHMYRWH